MKLIFITREGYSLAGARIRCYNFARELRERGVDAEILSFADNLGAKCGIFERQMGITEKLRLNLRAMRILLKKRNTFFYLQRFNYHFVAPYLANLFDKNKTILDLDDWEMRENPRYYFGIYPSSKAHYLTCRIAKRSAFCIAASRYLEEFLLQFNKKVYYIPSGVDTELFKPPLKNSDNKKIVFAWIGTFHKEEYIENIKFALDCFRELKRKYANIYFDIVGDGIYRDVLDAAINKFNEPGIQLKGWIEPDNIPSYLADIHIGLLPMARNTKFNMAKSPAKLFEYMAMAKPTVSSRIGEAEIIVKDGENGFLAGGREEFTEKMRKLIEDSSLRVQMGAAARASVEREYSLKVLGRRLYNIISVV